MTPTSAWANFYVIVGSSAGALIGLQFVVITLIANMPVGESGALASSTFATPTIVHFSVVLLLSAVLNAPWNSIDAAADAWGLIGLAGLIYSLIVIRRMRSQNAYRPEFEDWLFHAALPFLAYANLVLSSYLCRAHAPQALCCVAASSLLLLFIGIHNAWDAVTYHVFFVRRRAHQRPPDFPTPNSSSPGSS
jgi:hypothetical protein